MVVLINFFLIVLFILLFEYIPILELLNIDQKYFNIIKISILLVTASDIITYVLSVFNRALYPFNYYPKTQWIGLAIIIIIPASQIFSLFYGFKIIELSIVTFAVSSVANFFYLIFVIRFIKNEKIKYNGLYLKKNLKHLFNSLYLFLGSLVNVLKNEGSRLILLPFVGTVQLVTYVAIRTANNLIRKFFYTFSNSFLIEFSGYINKKDKKKFTNSYKIIYLLLSILVTPIAFIFQIVASDIFEIWTQNKLEFDPVLFASMTTAFLIIIFYNPGLLILKSKNLFKDDMIISIISSTAFIMIFMILVKQYSMRGAGYTLILVELITAGLTLFYSNRWLKKKFIKFNSKILFLSFIDILISSVFIFLYACNIDKYLELIIIFFLYKSIFSIYFFRFINLNY
tara:strand:- start:325 stop:1521 length:1197 start_codon:yes stop_codon:yes gene_type:complete